MRDRICEERGNIYVEALIAIAVLAVGLLPVFGGWALTAGAQVQTARKNQALAVARAQLEPLHALSPAAWESLPPSENIPDTAGQGFTITRTSALRPDLAGLKTVTVTVAWVDRSGRPQSVALATAVARRP